MFGQEHLECTAEGLAAGADDVLVAGEPGDRVGGGLDPLAEEALDFPAGHLGGDETAGAHDETEEGYWLRHDGVRDTEGEPSRPASFPAATHVGCIPRLRVETARDRGRSGGVQVRSPAFTRLGVHEDSLRGDFVRARRGEGFAG